MRAPDGSTAYDPVRPPAGVAISSLESQVVYLDEPCVRRAWDSMHAFAARATNDQVGLQRPHMQLPTILTAHDLVVPTPAMPKTTAQVRWRGTITAIQPRAWVWRYRTDNRSHHHTGFNLWVVGDAGKVVVAISGLQQAKLGFRHGDTASGTAWPVQGKKREIAELYRAGDLRVLERPERDIDRGGPPFVDSVPALEIYERRGCRMLDAKLWGTVCKTCMWANKSRVEIEFDFNRPKAKRYRSETFCYGPKSCPLYAMGEPREVPYTDTWPAVDDGELDCSLTDWRGADE